MGSQKLLLLATIAATVIALGIGIDLGRSDSHTRTIWQQAVTPGSLSQSHASLASQCVACHSPLKGVEPARCVTCHADNTALLQRQPTAFHANVQVCSGCHVEHRGSERMPTTMDHSLLAEVGRQQLEAVSGTHPRIHGSESMLDCASCHATKDRHQGLFGSDCVQCHATAQWTVAQFVHPSARATECAQCHQPPPSHNMMHFSMMSAPIAGQRNAKVEQCYLCHQSTSWNDIKGAGRVKHH